MGDNGKKEKKSKAIKDDIKLQELTALRNLPFLGINASLAVRRGWVIR